MNMFLEVVLWLAIFSASFSIICIGIIFCQYFARKSKIFGQYIKNGWIARNFDTPALCISVLLLIYFFFMSGSKTVNDFIMDKTLLVGALLGFPILIKRVDTSQESLKETQKQTRTSQYNAANELLWSEGLSSRMAGIESLWRVAQTYPKEDYHNVMDVFTQFIKHPASYKWEEGTKEEDKKVGNRADISAILRHMGEGKNGRGKAL